MIGTIALFSLQIAVGGTAQLVGDTIVIPSIGAHLTVPSLWMGRVPPGASILSPGPGRFGCQLHVEAPVRDRVVTEPERLRDIDRGVLGERRTYQEALDSALPRETAVAHLGGDPFRGNCVSPQVRVYLLQAPSRSPDFLADRLQGVIGRSYTGVQRVVKDSASWSLIRLSWTEDNTDFIHPASLELWSQRTDTGAIIILGVMDSWSGWPDVGPMLGSFRFRQPTPRLPNEEL